MPSPSGTVRRRRRRRPRSPPPEEPAPEEPAPAEVDPPDSDPEAPAIEKDAPPKTEAQVSDEPLDLPPAVIHEDGCAQTKPTTPAVLLLLLLRRRAWMLPSPAGRRVRAPVDVAAVVAPRALEDEPRSTADASSSRVWLLSLDARLTLARLVPLPAEPLAILQGALAAGAVRIVVARTRPSRAVLTTDDSSFAEQLEAAARVVGVTLVDIVILGDDGFCSLMRLGTVPHVDPRYR